jgi:PAS domain S-box-containing protein
VRFNSYLEALSGYRLAEVQGRDWLTTFLPARDWGRIRAVFEQAFDGIPTRGNVNPIVTKAGQERQIAWFDTRLTDADGKVTGLLSIGHDLTERQDAEVALRKQEHQLQLLTDALPALIAYVDSEQRYRFNNLTYERWFGQPRSAVYGKHVAEVLGSKAYEAIRTHIEAALAGQNVTYEETLPYQQGGTRTVHVACVPDIDDAGHVQGFFSLASDITERKRTEAALRRTKHLELLGRLAAGVSHELRNPLSAVFLLIEIIEAELQQPSPDSQLQINESVSEIKSALTRMHELVQDYLSLARLPSAQRQPTDLETFVTACIREMAEPLANHNITLVFERPGPLGQVPLHPNSLRRALRNLMQNALEAMPEGGRLTLRGQRTATQVHLEIRDTGVGIPEDELPLIFEPLHTTKSNGTGLGLYLVREIVAAHEGRIEVHSTPGEGTTFTLTLPRVGAGLHSHKAPAGVCLGGSYDGNATELDVPTCKNRLQPNPDYS